MPVLPNMGITLPTLGGDSGSWDDLLNAGVTLIDSHDHTSGKGVQVPSAGININADLSYGGFTITSLGKISFTAITAPVSGSKNLFVNSADNELYWRTNGGTNVKLTAGTSINTTLVGGIVGDYTAVGAEAAYDDANDRYTFKQQGGTWARHASGDVRLYETGTSESVYVGLKAPAGLAASIDLTMPLVFPASQAIMQMSTTGVISCSNSLSVSPEAPDWRWSTPKVLVIPPEVASPPLPMGAASPSLNYQSGWSTAAGDTDPVVWPITLRVLDRILEWSLAIRKNSNATETIRAELYKIENLGGATVATKIGATQDNSANAPGTTTLGQASLTETVATDTHYIVQCSGINGIGNDFFGKLRVTYDRQ